jgi:nitroreductase
MIHDLVIKNRSYRRFDQSVEIPVSDLENLVELARLSSSSRNLQPLKYLLSNSAERNKEIFSALSWAGYLKDWPGPEEGERPSAYIVMLGDTKIAPAFSIDPGIAAQSILLGAIEKGYGGCIIGTINTEKLEKTLKIPSYLEAIYVIALGRPVEVVKIEDMGANGDVKYWRDENRVHHVPKRLLKDIIVDFGPK